ncbi:unnamed protein product [Protopolystoma xenopodis]|uniref:Uncharacterized protein n=1 Tax=Protopolystoma xenopodis TaxID=117903 RepID=A0A3S5A8G5_9PLAT|nr:unnamed protein product [Protopolystoma xenopodis]
MKMRVEQNGTDEKRWEDKNNDASGQNFSKEQQIPSETTFNPADRSSFYNHAGSEGSQSSQMHACLTSPSKHAIEHVDPFSPTCVRQPLALPPRPDSVSKVQSISHQSIPPVPPNMPVSSPDNSCPPANRYANMSKSSRPICGTATGSWLPNSIMQPLAALNSRTSMDAEIRASLGLAMLHFSRRTTMHGVAHIAQARNNRGRLFWLAIMLAASVGFLINLISIVDKYWSVPILTNTLHESEGFQFPDITICNLNPIYLPPEDTPEYREMLESLRAFQRLQKRKSVLRNRMSRDKQQYTEPARRVRRQASGSTNKTAFQHAEEWQVSENTSSPRSDHTLLEESTTDLEELFRRLQALSRSSGKDLLRHRRSGALETNDNPSEPTKVTQMSGNSSDTHDWNVKGDRMRFVDKETNEAEREKSEELGLIMDKMTGFVHTNFVDWMYTQGKKFSHPAWSFIRHCKFHRDDCNYSHFYEQNIWPYGNCFTFNPELAKYTRIINKNITLNGFLPNFEVGLLILVSISTIFYPKKELN